MSVNKVILLGYVGADPEITFPEKDLVIARFTLATMRHGQLRLLFRRRLL